MKRKVLIAQSGGPTPVINNSLRGVIDACRAYPDVFDTVYAGWHGIEGVLKEELLDVSSQDQREIDLLATTPAAGAIGTCRYKLKSEQREDFARVVEVLKAHNIGYFFYNGGNDSMDTANKVAKLTEEGGLDLIATGIPKTIDNDVGDAEFTLIDHTPGYGSVARYWANSLCALNEENAGSCPADPVMVAQVMGRRIGYIPAAARLADPNREMPMQIYMPESELGLKELAENVNSELKRSGRCIVVLSEGFDVGDVGAQRDAFGHVEFGASDLTAQQTVVSYLNKVGLAASGKARGQVPGTDQRHSIFLASTVDLEEAYQVGCEAVEIAKDDGNGWMSTILRVPDESYRCRYNRVPLGAVANSERTFPEKWLSENRIDVTDDFIRYAQPLIGEENPRIPMENGLPRFTRFKPIFAAKRCDDYIPETHR